MNRSKPILPPSTSRTVLLPGALAPAHWLATSEVRARLQRLSLANWDLSPAVPALEPEPTGQHARRLPHEHWLAKTLGWTQPTAPAQDWFAVPVRLTIGLDHLVLSNLDPTLTDQEGQLLAQSIEPLLADEGVRLTRHRIESTEVWQLHFERGLNIDACSPLAALGQDTHARMPSGPDAGRWRKFAHEIEMAWHCAGPDQRFANAQPFPVNSLWLAGPVPLNPGIPATLTGSQTPHPFGEITVIDAGSAITQAQIGASAHLADAGSRPTLWLDARALNPRLAGDLEGWVTALEAIDATLKTNDLPCTQVVMSGCHALRIWQSGPRAAEQPGAWLSHVSIPRLAALARRALWPVRQHPTPGATPGGADGSGHLLPFFTEPIE